MKEVVNLKVNNRSTLLGSYLLGEIEQKEKLFYTTVSAQTLQQQAEGLIMEFHSKHRALGAALRLIEIDSLRVKLRQQLSLWGGWNSSSTIPTPRLTLTLASFSSSMILPNPDGNIWFNNGT